MLYEWKRYYDLDQIRLKYNEHRQKRIMEMENKALNTMINLTRRRILHTKIRYMRQ